MSWWIALELNLKDATNDKQKQTGNRENDKKNKIHW